MTESLSGEIQRRIKEAEAQYHRLVLVVGPARSGKTIALQQLAQRSGYPLLNVNLCLSERILDVTVRQRALRTPKLLDELIGTAGANVVLLDNIEMLFDRDLRQDPLRLLQRLSRSRTVVAAWPGEVVGIDLVYAEPGHPEYRRYTSPEALLVHREQAV